MKVNVTSHYFFHRWHKHWPCGSYQHHQHNKCLCAVHNKSASVYLHHLLWCRAFRNQPGLPEHLHHPGSKRHLYPFSEAENRYPLLLHCVCKEQLLLCDSVGEISSRYIHEVCHSCMLTEKYKWKFRFHVAWMHSYSFVSRVISKQNFANILLSTLASVMFWFF